MKTLNVNNLENDEISAYEIKKESFSPVKIIIVAIAIIYFSWCAFNPFKWNIFYGVDFFAHEAGHYLIFTFDGMFLKVAGGTIMQLLVPLIIVVYFYIKRQYFSSSLVLFWFGENFFQIAFYMADAINMDLPLLGGAEIHDWNYLLSYLNILSAAPALVLIVRILGVAVYITAVILSFLNAKDFKLLKWK